MSNKEKTKYQKVEIIKKVKMCLNVNEVIFYKKIKQI